MCPPKYFDIEYEINEWMDKANPVNHGLAAEQWQKLHDIYTKGLGWDVRLITPVAGLPDMVFATDNCIALGGKIMLSRFRYPQRQPETARYEDWLREHGYGDIKQPRYLLEGGDILFFDDKIIAGYGFRTEREAHEELANYFGREVISIQIVDPYFYHLDTAVAVLNNSTVAFYPGAIDRPSRKLLQNLAPNLIEASQEEAKSFGLNAVSDGHNVVYSDHSQGLAQKYQTAGFKTIGVPMREFQKSGGGVKCLTLEL